MIELNYSGVIVGISSFLIIGLFHPLVVKAEYWFGVKFWRVFLAMGLAGLTGSLLVAHKVWSILLGVFAFSSFWGIREMFEQRERVLKGWFPKRKTEQATPRHVDIAIQDAYGERFQYCWGCGPKNREGLHLKSYPIEEGEKCICRFTPPEKYTGGVPDNLFGGMMAVIFDCHGTASAAWFAHHYKGLELTEDTVIGRFVTARLEVDFKKSLPMNEEITVISVAEEVGERKVIVNMEMEAGGVIRAKARMVAVGVKDTM